MRPTPARILPAIVLAQFAGTSLWFAVNGVIGDIQRDWALAPAALGWLTAAVQAGFVAGTLSFALLTVADRFSPRAVFLACAIAGATCNATATVMPQLLGPLLAARFATGFFLAGIYPVGMKIASGWYERGLGAALGVLVGALVLGTALPHGLRAVGAAWPWQWVTLAVSAVAVGGGLLLFAAVPDGPHLRRSPRIDPRGIALIWRDPKLRAPALGYFGHMWELYAFWTLAPAIVATRLSGPAVSAASFAVIGAGSLGCALGGLLSLRVGSARVAFVQLGTSACCCLASPWMLQAPDPAFAAWLFVWGVTVVGDSPQFSTLTARNAPLQLVGSLLTFVNSIGFGLTALLIPPLTALAQARPLGEVLPLLAIGPAAGLLAMRPLLREGKGPG